MCWQGYLTDKHIAKEDVKVFKVVYRRQKGWHSIDPKYKEIYVSPYMSMKYLKGKDYTYSNFYTYLCPIKLIEVSKVAVRIEEGFHSYRPDYCTCELTHDQLVVKSNFGNRECIKHPMTRYNRYRIDQHIPVEAVAMECIIPAGSEYWVNYEGEVVSTAIRFIKEIKP